MIAVAVLGALLLGIVLFVVSRALTYASSSREYAVSSFAGGVSLAFVMLQLFVELVEGAEQELHEIVRAGPEPVHTMALLLLFGTVASFAAAAYGTRRAESRSSYLVAFVPHVVYGALVGAALSEEMRASARAAVVFWLAMALHLGVADHRFVTTFPRTHRIASSAAFACALVVGAFVWSAAHPPEAAFHVVLAIVAGTTLLEVFQEEIPPVKHVRVGAFLAGVAAFGALVQVRWRL